MRILRRIAAAALLILLILFATVQIQQHLLRHRAERLHAEILALQLHPGTFADLQRLQKGWGAHAHYDGECTPHHCTYTIRLRESLLDKEKIWDSPYAQTILGAYQLLGARPSRAFGGVQLRNNRMWGEYFTLETLNYSGIGRNEGQPYFLMASVASSPRLSYRGEIDPRHVHAGFRATEELHCLGCEYTAVNVTEQTHTSDILRFNQLNLSCITRLIRCQHPTDLAPDISSEAKRHQPLSNPPESTCTLPARTLAQEADDILQVRVLQLEQIHSPEGTGYKATVEVLQPMKNAIKGRAPGNLVFFTTPHSVYQSTTMHDAFAIGRTYFFLYQHRSANSVYTPYSLDDCLAIPDTPALRVEVERGIALDGSTGEPYDYSNEPGYTSLF